MIAGRGLYFSSIVIYVVSRSIHFLGLIVLPIVMYLIFAIAKSEIKIVSYLFQNEVVVLIDSKVPIQFVRRM